MTPTIEKRMEQIDRDLRELREEIEESLEYLGTEFAQVIEDNFWELVLIC